MNDATERARKFFKLDTRYSAPEDFEPPRDDIIAAGLWTDVLVEYSRDALKYTSLVDRNIVYRVRETEGMGTLIPNARICKRLKMLVIWGCIRNVVWVFHSQPLDFVVDTTGGPFLSFLVDSATFGVESLEFHMAEYSGFYLLDLLNHAPELADVRLRFVLVLRGTLASSCLLREVMFLIDERESWQHVLELYIDVNKFSGRTAQICSDLKPRIRDIKQIEMYLAPTKKN
ncbi:hypothetical protein TRVA0_009S01794 [Trichomonascus vanleenenianus]|uniref:uncharacterized protein n=1 Tax=Trichomonascus vanleenenianus TaxID=2268995 RepID=UPI003ECA9122